MKLKTIILAIVFLVICIVGAGIIYYINTHKIDSEGFYTKTTKVGEVTIPKGFKIIENEDNLNAGLVIEDKQGNQFVWIPVDEENLKLVRRTFEEGNITEFAEKETIGRTYNGEESPYSCLYAFSKQEENYKYCIQYFKESVEKNKGFYVARFETSQNEQGEIITKQGYAPYTQITRDEALSKSMGMYNKDETGVVSSLINSYAWDTTLQFIENTQKGYAEKEATQTELQNTGESEDVACNIYDLAGNVKEWSTEYSNYGYYEYTSPCVTRGGYYKDNMGNASSRSYNGDTIKNEFTGFRVVLYF